MPWSLPLVPVAEPWLLCLDTPSRLADDAKPADPPAALLSLLVANAAADTYNRPQMCAQSCFQALSDFVFGDFKATGTYYTNRCNSRLLVMLGVLRAVVREPVCRLREF